MDVEVLKRALRELVEREPAFFRDLMLDALRSDAGSLEELAKWAEVVEDLILPAETGRWSDGLQNRRCLGTSTALWSAVGVSASGSGKSRCRRLFHLSGRVSTG